MPTHWVEPDDMASMAGTKLPSSDWMTVEQDRINTFADCTEDHQFIHIDEAAAAKSPFGGTIAHGFLTLSLLTKLSSENSIGVKGIVMGVNYGIDKLRFLRLSEQGSAFAHTQKYSALIEKMPTVSWLRRRSLLKSKVKRRQRSMQSGWVCSSLLNSKRRKG